MRRTRGLVLIAVLALAGCGDSLPPHLPASSAAAALTVTSSAFGEGTTIPVEFTCSGAGSRPALAWRGDLHGAAALAVIVDDPDAPGGEFYHWGVVDLPAGTTTVGATVPAPAHELKNSAGGVGWTPPCPPSGTHHYRFTVYGLSAPTGLAAGAGVKDALTAIEKTAVVQGRLTGLVTHTSSTDVPPPS